MQRAIWEHPFDDLLTEAVAFHGHLCPGQVLGVRMAMAGCREVGMGVAAVRVAAREDAREAARRAVPDADPRRAQLAAYRVLSEDRLLAITPVTIAPGWLDRPRVRVACEACGEAVNYRREVRVEGRVLCRACAGAAYYAYDTRHIGAGPGPRTMVAIAVSAGSEGG